MQPQSLVDSDSSYAKKSEKIRRRCIDYLYSQRYSLVETCALDDAARFTTHSGSTFVNNSFTITDPLNGRTLLLRPDITPQIARLDMESSSNTKTINRFCYSSMVYRTNSTTPGSYRNQHQIGAELFGVQEIKGDIEMIKILVYLLQLIKISPIYLDIGNVSIFRTIIEPHMKKIDHKDVFINKLLAAFQLKSHSDLQAIRDSYSLSTNLTNTLHTLIDSYGQPAKVFLNFKSSNTKVNEEINKLKKIINTLKSTFSMVDFSVDLGELHGYSYKSGLVFSAYTPKINQELARGGRYDGMTSVKGKPRPGVGFSFIIDLLLDVIK